MAYSDLEWKVITGKMKPKWSFWVSDPYQPSSEHEV